MRKIEEFTSKQFSKLVRLALFPKLAILFMLLTSGDALAQDTLFSWDPPARYSRPYEGNLVEIALPPSEITAFCVKYGRMEYRGEVRGCSWTPYPGTCIIVYPDRLWWGVTPPEAVKRHEIGHCNGWPHDHPR